MKNLTKSIADFIAITSIGNSTIRNMGEAGNNEKVREFLKTIPLEIFFEKVQSDSNFRKWLNIQTRKLIRSVKFHGNGFGPSRKCINIYLRNILYNGIICDYYGLKIGSPAYKNAINRLEIPIDSFSAKGLIRDAGEIMSCPRIPTRWNSVISLSETENVKFQEAARYIAESKGISRVHLDLLYFRNL
jgi:hypothetical protein